jgi:putative NADH-flavin reductase
MKLTVFGASGGIGTEVVRQGLAAGHHITAVVRQTSKLDVVPQPSLELVVADIMDPTTLAPAIAGRDAVISALGPRGSGPTTVLTTGTQSIIQAMHSTAAATNAAQQTSAAHAAGPDPDESLERGVRRLIVVSVAGIHSAGDDPFTRFVVKPVLGRILRHSWADAREMEARVRKADLDATIVCPPKLSNAPAKGKLRSNKERTVLGGFSITRADVATYLLAAAADDAVIGSTVFVAN